MTLTLDEGTKWYMTYGQVVIINMLVKFQRDIVSYEEGTRWYWSNMYDHDHEWPTGNLYLWQQEEVDIIDPSYHSYTSEWTRLMDIQTDNIKHLIPHAIYNLQSPNKRSKFKVIKHPRLPHQTCYYFTRSNHIKNMTWYINIDKIQSVFK